jgi:hypothetical protein
VSKYITVIPLNSDQEVDFLCGFATWRAKIHSLDLLLAFASARNSSMGFVRAAANVGFDLLEANDGRDRPEKNSSPPGGSGLL